MRVSTKMMYDGILQGLSHRTERIMKIHKSISSGKRVNELSDDPLAMTQILDYRTSLAAMDQYAKNIDHGTSWLRMTESSLYEANQPYRLMAEGEAE